MKHIDENVFFYLRVRFAVSKYLGIHLPGLYGGHPDIVPADLSPQTPNDAFHKEFTARVDRTPWVTLPTHRTSGK